MHDPVIKSIVQVIPLPNLSGCCTINLFILRNNRKGTSFKSRSKTPSKDTDMTPHHQSEDSNHNLSTSSDPSPTLFASLYLHRSHEERSNRGTLRHVSGAIEHHRKSSPIQLKGVQLLFYCHIGTA
eukprot:TRINITY_DN4807_c0_g4_i1.p1 TRINITY_DN4807_c0_g4~~TRINITY_DN4807_c0_g4_i1.p1  ORF type:complete len:126 (-),score=12.83 TRINITY_DN4807_c0_g4_i1:206-583(-)